MNKLTMSTRDAAQAVRLLAVEHPEWLAVLDAALAVAQRTESYGGEFAGAWVVEELARRGQRRWIPNLRLLVSYGLLDKSGPSTRGGRRAYYRMPDRTGVAQALREFLDTGVRKRRDLGFIAAGASTQPPRDMARKAGEVSYEPRSWR